MSKRILQQAFIATVATAASVVGAGCFFGATSNPPEPESCPTVQPTGGDFCNVTGLSCDYDDGCNGITYTCEDAAWVASPIGTCNPPPAECPATAPEVGTLCNEEPGTFDGYPSYCTYDVSTPCGEQPAVLGCQQSPISLEYEWVIVEAPSCEAEPSQCQAYASSALCEADVGCSWRVPGCGDELGAPAVPTGCYPSADCEVSGCGDWGTCTNVTFDPCWNSLCDACGAETNVCIPNES